MRTRAIAAVAIIGGAFAVPATAQLPPEAVVGALIDPQRLRGVEDVHIHNDIAYLPCREGNQLTVVSIADPTQPTVLATFRHPELNQCAGFALHGDTAYITSQDNQRLLVLNVSDPAAPQLLGSVRLGDSEHGTLYKVAYANNHCYVAHQSEQRLYAVDVAEPTAPRTVNTLRIGGKSDGPFSVTLIQNHAYIGTIFGTQNRLAVVNLSSPPELKLEAQLLGPTIGHISGDRVENRLYAVNWAQNAFFVFNVSQPNSPKPLATLADKRLGAPNRCAVLKDRAYLPMVEGHGIAIINIADPNNPQFLRSHTDPRLQKTYGIAIQNGLLYLGAREGNALLVLNPKALE